MRMTTKSTRRPSRKPTLGSRLKKTAQKLFPESASRSGPLGHLRDTARGAGEEFKDAAKKTGKAVRDAAYEGADELVDAVAVVAKKTVKKVAAALDDAVK